MSPGCLQVKQFGNKLTGTTSAFPHQQKELWTLNFPSLHILQVPCSQHSQSPLLNSWYLNWEHLAPTFKQVLTYFQGHCHACPIKGEPQGVGSSADTQSRPVPVCSQPHTASARRPEKPGPVQGQPLPPSLQAAPGKAGWCLLQACGSILIPR